MSLEVTEGGWVQFSHGAGKLVGRVEAIVDGRAEIVVPDSSDEPKRYRRRLVFVTACPAPSPTESEETPG